MNSFLINFRIAEQERSCLVEKFISVLADLPIPLSSRIEFNDAGGIELIAPKNGPKGITLFCMLFYIDIVYISGNAFNIITDEDIEKFRKYMMQIFIG